ncbi:hypothetical protein A0H81_05297 [Grifola frondosa]|uniref:Peptide hydrolase n=1 Tax=Grifola frondosa TaxID=5627 RepID=A0A1C7MJ33_GRIFR|nr:hypothetical protein A0H81_05297 [Grifola frondosa]
MLANTVIPLASLLITPYDPHILSVNPCLSDSYYGTYGTQSVFVADNACIDSSTNSLTQGIVAPFSAVQQLIWLQHQAVEEAIKPVSFVDELDALLSELSHPEYVTADEQRVLSNQRNEMQLLSRTASSALISVDSETARTIDTRLPRFWKSSPLPSSPVPFIPVPSDAVKRVRQLLSTVKFDPVVASVVNNISIPQLRRDIRYLTGEDPASSIVSRHSFSDGALVAAAWLKEHFEATGASCTLKEFLNGFAPNVVCSYKGTVNTTETVLLSAHYDSRGSFGSTRAPGGNDDGSGTTALLGIARTIARKGITFRKNVQLCAFAGEEQGLYGSRYYAKELREKDANLTLMIQADMLGYHAAGEPPQLGLPDRIGTPEVTQLVANLSAIYSPELKVGFTPACCSDHQSFHEQGFPATQVFERAGRIADPMYHNSGDLSEREGYDFEQIKSIAKVQFAALLHAAGFDLLE